MKRHAFSERSLLILGGSDRLSFLNRLSTNLIAGLGVGCSIETVFTDANARIIDHAIIGNQQQMTFIIGHLSNRQRLLQHLKQKTLLDDVTINDATNLNTFIRMSEEHEDGIIVECNGATLVSDGYCTLAVISQTTSNDALLQDSVQSPEHIEKERIRALRPGIKELTTTHTPYNVALGHLVHEDKGCYLGQEVLARMQSRARFGKQMVFLEEGELEEGINGVTSICGEIGLAVLTHSQN